MNAGDAHYASLLHDITESKKRQEESELAKEKGSTAYWYFIYEDYCPVCGKSNISKERMYTPRPARWEDRHQMVERYDWCEE